MKKIFSMALILGLVTPEMQVHGYSKAKVYGGTAGGFLGAAAIGNAVKYGRKQVGSGEVVFAGRKVKDGSIITQVKFKDGSTITRVKDGSIITRFNPATGNLLEYKIVDGKEVHVSTLNQYLGIKWDKDGNLLATYNPFLNRITSYPHIMENGKFKKLGKPSYRWHSRKGRGDFDTKEERDKADDAKEWVTTPDDISPDDIWDNESNDSYSYAYNPKSKHQYTDSDGKEFTVTKGEGIYTKCFKNGAIKTFDNKGLLLSETLEDGTVKNYEYGVLHSVHSPNGLITVCSRDAEGKINGYIYYNNPDLSVNNGNKVMDNNSGIELTPEDMNGTRQMDKGGTTVVTNEQNAATRISNQDQVNEDQASGQGGKSQTGTESVSVNKEGNANSDSYTDANEGGGGEGGAGEGGAGEGGMLI